MTRASSFLKNRMKDKIALVIVMVMRKLGIRLDYTPEYLTRSLGKVRDFS